MVESLILVEGRNEEESWSVSWGNHAARGRQRARGRRGPPCRGDTVADPGRRRGSPT
jgi:hypothetical protein